MDADWFGIYRGWLSLMMGPDANTVDGKFDPNSWNDDIFSIRRIRIAPLICCHRICNRSIRDFKKKINNNFI
jgi:hypothetical protein